jgi:hypothetical protein
MVPGYLKTFRQAIRKPEGNEINEKNEIRGREEALNSFNSSLDRNSQKSPLDGASHHTSRTYQATFDALERRCPDFVPNDRWQQAIQDATAFVSEWGAQAQAFSWTARELFGLHPVPERRAANMTDWRATIPRASSGSYAVGR